jgi:hypothetical protein
MNGFTPLNAVAGPASATDNAVARFDTTTGKLVQNSGITIDDSGRLLMPTMSAFLAQNGSTATDVTGDGTTVTVTFGTEVLDRGGDFASNTFTAPVTGIYSFTGTVTLTGLTIGSSNITVNLVTSNRTYQVSNGLATGTTQSIAWSATCVDMDAADTAIVQLTCANSAKVVDVFGAAGSPVYTCFAGYLIG